MPGASQSTFEKIGVGVIAFKVGVTGVTTVLVGRLGIITDAVAIVMTTIIDVRGRLGRRGAGLEHKLATQQQLLHCAHDVTSFGWPASSARWSSMSPSAHE